MSLCDHVCQQCPILDLCGGIEKPNYRCPFLGCPWTGSDAVGKMRYCYVCHLHELLYKMSPEELRETIHALSDITRQAIPRIQLPKFVPLISFAEPDSYVWKSAKCDAIILEFYEIMLSGRISEALGKGIHDVLQYDGRVLLSSIMPDEFLVKTSIFDKFCQVAAEGGFDGVIGWDIPVYDDIPLYDSWTNLLMGLQLTEKMLRLDMPVLGLAKGNNGRQIEYSTSTLARIGIDNFALHASEYLVNWKHDPHARNILYLYSTHLQDHADTILIIGASSPRTLNFVRSVFPDKEKIRIAGLSWYLDAKRHAIYWKDSSMTELRREFVECDCLTCSNTNPLGFAEDASVRAAHNYEVARKMTETQNIPHMRTLDFALPEGQTIVAGDLHIGSNLSQYNDFLGLVLNEKPKAIIFLGAIFDLNENIRIDDVKKFFSTLRQVDCITTAVSGCCDNDPDKLLQRLERLSFGDTHQAFALKKPEDMDDTYVADFFRFHRSMKKKLTLELGNGDTVVLKHGHTLFPDPRVSISQITQEMRWDKEKEDADMLIIGHLHRAFLNKPDGIASPGTWQLPTPIYKPVINKDDLLHSIIIEEDGSVFLA